MRHTSFVERFSMMTLSYTTFLAWTGELVCCCESRVRIHTSDDKVCPAWRPLESNTFNDKICCILCIEENRTKVSVGSILEFVNIEI